MDESVIDALVADCRELYKYGSSDPVLARCQAILMLPAVRETSTRGVSSERAAFVLLREAARNPQGNYEVAPAGALTGIEPRSKGGRSGRDSAAQGDRRRAAHHEWVANRAKPAPGRELHRALDLSVSEPKSTRYDKIYDQDKAFKAYAIAILEFANGLSISPDNLDTFCHLCRSSDASAEESGIDVTLEISAIDEAPSIKQADPPAKLVRPIAGRVLTSLEAARDHCIADGRRFYTYDVLWAILNFPGTRAAVQINEQQPGLAGEIRVWLTGELEWLVSTKDEKEQYVNFDWPEVSIIQDAERYALSQDSINELHLLRAILEGTTPTCIAFAEKLGAHHGPLLASVRSYRWNPKHTPDRRSRR